MVKNCSEDAVEAAQCATASVVWNELTYGGERLEPAKCKAELGVYLRDVVFKWLLD